MSAQRVRRLLVTDAIEVLFTYIKHIVFVGQLALRYHHLEL